MLAGKGLAAWAAVHQWWVMGPSWLAVALTVVALLCWAPVRQVLRYTLAVAAMAVLRSFVAWGAGIADPGGVTDPAASWRQWLDVRCAGCGW